MLKNETQKSEDIEFNRGFKFVVAFLAFAITMTFASYAYAQVVTSWNYDSFRDEYIYSYNTSYSNKMTVQYQGSETWGPITYGTPYYNGTFYLACNGTFTIKHYQFDTLKKTDIITTSSIVNHQCAPLNDNGGGGSGGDGGGSGGTGGGGGTGGDGGSICNCPCFQTQEWQNLMNTLNNISNQIPPPPDWQSVANTMRDTIVPRMIDDLDNLIGRAPSPPPIPDDLPIQEPARVGQPQDLPDYADRLKESEPIFEEVPGLAESGYTLDDIKREAPEIEFREDPTGGFNIGNPLEMLPSIPSEPPIPGQGDAGEWDHQPKEQELKTPIPSGGGEVDVIAPPVPDSGNNSPPIPNEEYTPPAPNQNEIDMGNYKRHPEHPDGSG